MAEEREKSKSYWLASGAFSGSGLTIMLAIQGIIGLIEQYFGFTPPLLLVQIVITLCGLSIFISIIMALISAWNYPKPKKTRTILGTIFIVAVLLAVTQFIFNQKDYKEVITAQQKTLLELFREDNFGLMVSHQDLDVEIAGEKIHGLIKRYMPFYANAEFLGVYIPRSKVSYEFVSALPEQYEGLLDFNKSLYIEAQAPGEIGSTNTEDLVFTGRIYIYHEDFFTSEQQHRLYDLYKRKGLSLILRGPSYLSDKWLRQIRGKENDSR